MTPATSARSLFANHSPVSYSTRATTFLLTSQVFWHLSLYCTFTCVITTWQRQSVPSLGDGHLRRQYGKPQAYLWHVLLRPSPKLHLATSCPAFQSVYIVVLRIQTNRLTTLCREVRPCCATSVARSDRYVSGTKLTRDHVKIYRKQSIVTEESRIILPILFHSMKMFIKFPQWHVHLYGGLSWMGRLLLVPTGIH